MSYGTSSTSTSSSRRTVTAFFDNRRDADEAIERLVAAGLSRGDVQIVEGGRGGTQGSAGTQGSVSSSSYPHEGTGFWEALKDMFLPDEDRHVYAEGLSRGGYLVTVRASDAHYDRVVDILDDEGTIDMDERERSWRSEGWSGYTGSDYTRGTGALGAAATASTTTGSPSTTSSRTAATGTASTQGDRLTTGREEAIPIVEENLRVGKREVNQGRVRVRSYVVETPVQEQVRLREEHVEVERRPVDRPLSDADQAVFRERTIEATEKAEQAVVAKEARVKEELVVKKDVEERTQTVSDTVRRTEVEVEDERGRVSGTGTTGSSMDRKR